MRVLLVITLWVACALLVLRVLWSEGAYVGFGIMLCLQLVGLSCAASLLRSVRHGR